MYRTFLLSALIIGMALLASIPLASAQFYVAGSAGVQQPFDNSGTVMGAPVSLTADTGYALAGAVGYRLPYHVRVEFEAGIERSGLDQFTVAGKSFHAAGNLDLRAITANVYYDIATETNFVPYVGGGLGFAIEYGLNANADGVTVGSLGNTSHFVWQLEAGLGYQLTDRLVIAPAYRFQQVEDTGNGLSNTQISIFKLALRYGF